MARSASGDNDLDLLVDRASRSCFTEILHQYGFKEARVPAGRQVPGIVDYYGHDVESGRLVHVHAHYQLVLGDDLTKNYRLPVEKPFLNTAVQGDLFRVPVPEFEYIVFVIRMVLKHSTLDAILRRKGRLSTSERRELEYLQVRVDEAEVRRLLAEHVEYLSPEFFADCVLALQPERSYGHRIMTGQRLERRLAPFVRRPQLVDVGLKLWRRGLWAFQGRTSRHAGKKRLAGGGLLVAIVGGDGSGKSTAVNGLADWLSHDFAVMKLHLGKPTWSLTTVCVRGMLKIGHSLGLYPYTTARTRPFSELGDGAFAGYPSLLRQVCTARDRYLAFRRARRFVDGGGVAICDRFPLPDIQSVDGPQVERMAADRRSDRMVTRLAGLERRYYRPIVQPDLLVALNVDPEICARRKTDEESVTVRARATEMWEFDWRDVPARIVDASRPKAEVLSELKGLIWSGL